MDRIKLQIFGLSSSQSQSGSFALVLGEEKGSRRLPIIIGMYEAQAIAIELERIKPNRPMTHDLFLSFAENFGFEVEEINISDLKEGVFYAKIVCTNGDNTVEIDARPSDAVAIGMRFRVPIYTTEVILSEAGIVLADSDEEETPKTVKKKTWLEQLKDTPADQLRVMLEETLAQEDYEKAAIIRDEMNKRN